MALDVQVLKSNDITVSVSPSQAPEIEAVRLLGAPIYITQDVTNTTYTYEQAVASAEWVIQHNLGRFPSVSVVDSAGELVEGAVKYIDENVIKVVFNGAFAGKAYLN